jgi:hypothetical protein
VRILFFVLIGTTQLAWSQKTDKTDFFETKIRPTLLARCGSCHGDKVQMGGKQFTSREGVHVSGVIVPGDPSASSLIQAVRYEGKIKMPPTAKLPEAEIENLVRWVSEGAIWPETTATAIPLQPEGYWAFQPVKKTAPPAVQNNGWPHSDIDRFILAKLEEKGLHPVRDADKYALLRRATLDLIGLLPTPAEIDEFGKDSSPDAFAKVVDRLLASPSYGDRWGRHWLDVTYYADTTGVGRRIPLPEAWRYRDYVIQSFNEDKPYDQFVREQIGSSKILRKQPDARESKVNELTAAATGFLVLGPWSWGAYDRVQTRLDAADLQVDLVGRTFLGLTLGCARCHDHKFDPIPNKEYYGLIGMFLSTKTMASDNDGGIHKVRLPETTESVKRYAGELEKYDKRVAEAEAADQLARKDVKETERLIVELKGKPGSAENAAALRSAEENLAAVNRKISYAGDKQVLAFIKYLKPRMPAVYAAEDTEYPEDARIARLGDAHLLGSFAPRGVLSAVSFGPAPEIAPRSSGRAELADWIADEKNPLTSRVYVNRIWHHLFGEGIVGTTENFGARGERPTHPELLDYLASRLTENGWSTKKVIREIVLSHVYQVASVQDTRANEVDADNKLLWRANRRRLEVETIRDAVLQVAGDLDPGRGGPALPLTAQNVHTIAPFFLEDEAIIEDNVKFRRTVYQPIMRNSQMEGIDILNLFDFKDPDQVVGTRIPTVVPTQTLYLMNSPFLKEESGRLAERLFQNKDLDDAGRVSLLIMWALNRPAAEQDIQQARLFLTNFGAGLSKARSGSSIKNDKLNDPVHEAWGRYCQAILISSEMLYRR